MTGAPWHQSPLVALDLEGSGAQDRDQEAILEIATVPIINTFPDIDNAYCTLVNPGRPIPKRPWTSPGLTNHTLRNAPTLDVVEPALAARLNSHYIVGHNISVDWHLLQRRCPTIQPAGLIDTLRLAKHSNTNVGNGLERLITANHLTTKINALAAGSQPHRALWDTLAAAILLATLVEQIWPTTPTLDQLIRIAGIPADKPPCAIAADQPGLFEL